MKSFYLYSAEEKQKALDFGKKKGAPAIGALTHFQAVTFFRAGIAPAFSKAVTSTGMRTSWRRIPGIAMVKAPLRKAAIPKGFPAIPKKTALATPETSRPATIAAAKEG